MSNEINLVYFSRAIELRAQAARCACRARAHPIGAERNELRRVASALRALSDTEAWLNGSVQSPRWSPHERRQRTRSLRSPDRFL